MNTPDGENRGLDLLLEDYDKRFRPGNGSAEPSASRTRTVLPPAEDGLEFRVLLEDYPQRTRAAPKQRNGSGTASTSPALRRAPPPAEHADERLRLLLEDYDPAGRFREATKNRPARLFPPTAGSGAAGAPHLDKLRIRWEPAGPLGRREAGAGSLVVHAIWITLLILQPKLFPPSPVRYDAPEITPFMLTAPSAEELAELTQTAPGPRKSGEFSGPAEKARPLLILPEMEPVPAAPPSKKPEDSEPDSSEPESVVEQETAPEPEPAATVEEDPEAPEKTPLVAARSPSPGELRRGTEFGRSNRPAELPAPRAPSRRIKNPRLVLEDPKAAMPGRAGKLRLGSLELTARTDQIIESALRRATTGQSGRPAVGDGVPGGMQGGYAPPSPGNTGSNLELLSDPKGVDFRPYLTQILASVRRNWHAVIPESARLGMIRGRVSLQFSVARDGSVPKLVIAASSGVPALDRAAVAGISASNPFPPLPADFNGQTVRLQFKFAYNMK